MERKIKVCFQSTFAYPLFNPKSKVKHGGSEVQVYLLAKELAKDEKYDVTVLVGDFGQKNIEYYDNVKVVKGHKLEKNAVNYIKGPIKLYRALKKINPDVVIQRSACAETSICAYYCKKNNKKFIYSVAGEWDVTGEFAKKGMVGKLFSYGLKNTDKIITQNKNQENALRKWRREKSKDTTLIKTGYEIPETSKTTKETILWVGRCHELKQPEIFISLSEKIPEEKFVMIMPKGNDIEKWNKLKKKSEKIQNLRLIEKVPFHKIEKHFQEAKIHVNTSKHEGFPNTFIQAAKNKTPIVSLNVNPDNFASKYGHYCKNNFEKLVEKTRTLAKDKSKIKELGSKAYKYVEKEHSIERIIEKWKKEIKRCMK